jgi:hypothetical protein
LNISTNKPGDDKDSIISFNESLPKKKKNKKGKGKRSKPGKGTSGNDAALAGSQKF